MHSKAQRGKILAELTLRHDMLGLNVKGKREFTISQDFTASSF